MGGHPQPDKNPPNWTRLAGMGLELAAAVTGFCLLGLWIDHRYRTGPYGTLVCALLGLVGGMFNFIRESLRAVKNQKPPPRHGEARPGSMERNKGDET